MKEDKKAIWFHTPNEEALNNFGANCMIENVGIKIVEIGPDFIKATMPVNEKTTQSYGILHGGASVVLAETIGSFGSVLVVDFPRVKAFGLDINSNHIRAVRSGLVTGIAKPLHLGRKTHVWEIKIYNEEEKLVNISRLTMAIIAEE